MPVDLGVFVRAAGVGRTVSGVRAMSAAMSWFASVVAVLGLVLALHHLGVDVSASVGTVVHDAELFLGQPLLPQ